MTETGGNGTGDADYVMQLVRERDVVRYFADLYAPTESRSHIIALHAFNAEVSSIPASVAESGLGELRFQWWHDAVSQAAEPDYLAETPVMRVFAHAIRECNLPVTALTGLIEARRNDLYGDPMPTLRDLEGYYGETESALFQLVCLILGSKGAETADASGHAGIAFGLTRHLANLAQLRRHGRQIASSDLLEVYSLDSGSLFSEKPPEGCRELIVHLANLARAHFENAREAVRVLPSSLQIAFLPLSVVPTTIRRTRRRPAKVLETQVRLSNLSVFVRMFKAAVAGI